MAWPSAGLDGRTSTLRASAALGMARLSRRIESEARRSGRRHLLGAKGERTGTVWRREPGPAGNPPPRPDKPQLRDLASQGPSNFGAISNRPFARDCRAHLFGVAFVSPADVLTESMGTAGVEFSDRELALLFRRQDHPLVQDPRPVLFQHR